MLLSKLVESREAFSGVWENLVPRKLVYRAPIPPFLSFTRVLTVDPMFPCDQLVSF